MLSIPLYTPFIILFDFSPWYIIVVTCATYSKQYSFNVLVFFNQYISVYFLLPNLFDPAMLQLKN